MYSDYTSHAHVPEHQSCHVGAPAVRSLRQTFKETQSGAPAWYVPFQRHTGELFKVIYEWYLEIGISYCTRVLLVTSSLVWYLYIKFPVTKVQRTIVIAVASLLLLSLLLSADTNFNLGHNLWTTQQVGLSYFLVTRPFQSNNNFWPSDLDLEVCPLFQKF